jgi:glycosyltransferase involved in cell wall biosynthesis
MNKVSVLITSYNKGKYIENTLLSVKKQTYNDIEIIIVDDFSDDKFTLNKLKSLSNSVDYIKFLDENIGVCEARNAGIKLATGKYILILDGDDLIAPTYIEKAVKILDENTEIKIVTCEVELFGYKKGKMKLSEPKIENLIAQNSIVISSLFRKEDFEKTNGFNSNMKEGLEDWDFWLSILENGGKVHRIPEILFFYRISKKSRNNLSTETLKTLRYQVYENHKELYAKYLLNPLESFEYNLLINSWEYKIGKKLLKPFRALFKLLNK